MAVQLKILHRFLECNLPEYERSDLLEVCKFYLKSREIQYSKTYVEVFNRLQDFKTFIIQDWQGRDKERFTRDVQSVQVKENFGRCTCGRRFVKRKNKKNGNEFLGCSGYPKCNNTMPL